MMAAVFACARGTTGLLHTRRPSGAARPIGGGEPGEEPPPLVASTVIVDPVLIAQCAHQISEQAENWRKTGGVHISMLFNRVGGLIKTAEAIGRHNSVD
jgi:hypothetical protein